jgi:hypothetical protein
MANSPIYTLGATATLMASGGAAAAPSGDVGLVIDESAFPSTNRVRYFLIKVKLTATGAVSAACFLWGRDRAGGDWGQLGDKLGQLNDGNPISGTDQRVYQNLIEATHFERLYLEVASLTGTDAAAEATISEVIEID